VNKETQNMFASLRFLSGKLTHDSKGALQFPDVFFANLRSSLLLGFWRTDRAQIESSKEIAQ